MDGTCASTGSLGSVTGCGGRSSLSKSRLNGLGPEKLAPSAGAGSASAGAGAALAAVGG